MFLLTNTYEIIIKLVKRNLLRSISSLMSRYGERSDKKVKRKNLIHNIEFRK